MVLVLTVMDRVRGLATGGRQAPSGGDVTLRDRGCVQGCRARGPGGLEGSVHAAGKADDRAVAVQHTCAFAGAKSMAAKGLQVGGRMRRLLFSASVLTYKLPSGDQPREVSMKAYHAAAFAALAGIGVGGLAVH